MFRIIRFIGLILCFALLLDDVLSADEILSIKGSDTIGGHLAPDLGVAFRSKVGRIPIQIEALGSATAFVGLFSGTADIGESSRPINATELESAKKLKMPL